MKRFLGWWKTEKRWELALKIFLGALLPSVLCLAYCLIRGKGLGDVYIPCSEWNDELFYYKQVESIVHFGYPQGYFGFNESTARELSFAAWSPILVFPWVLWGLIFGWNLMSPVLCNLFLFSLAVAVFLFLVRPSWKQEAALAALICVYTPYVRYILSSMPEIICFGILILFYGLAIRYSEKHSRGILAAMLGMGILMTWMRPYLVLFLLLPMLFWIAQSRWKGALGSAAVLGAAMAGYWGIKHYLGAEYFTDLFFTDWIKAFFQEGVAGGIHYTLVKLYYMGRSFLEAIGDGIASGYAPGSFFAGFLACGILLFWMTAEDFLRGRKEGKDGKDGASLLLVEGHLLFSFIAMFFALLLMYKLVEGSKHLLTFMATAVFVIPMAKKTMVPKILILGAVFLWFLGVKAVDPYDYAVPFASEERSEAITLWRDTLEKSMQLATDEKSPSFDNVVIWVLSDEVDGEVKPSRWQYLYALPEGFGISCCLREYVTEHLEELQSRYLAVNSGGEIDALCRQNGYTELMRDEELVLYRRGIE